jgi:hypothetical protein
MKKIAVLFVFLMVFLLLLVGINFLHFRYLTVNVVLYSTLADVIVATAIVAAMVAIIGRLSRPDSYIATAIHELTSAEIALSVIGAVLLGFIYAISVPTVIDRSLSIYLLEKLDQRGGAISLASMKDIVIKEYIPEHRLIDVRMTEQLSSGTLIIENGCVKLTPRGRRIVAFTRFFRTKLLPKRRVLMGEISDDLTDPFRNPEPVVDYRCRVSQSPQ